MDRASAGDSAADVEILMAAYNGGPYIAAQLDSLFRQTVGGWRLRVRDDRSTDDTYDIARDYAARYADRVAVGRRETNSGSAARNFLELLATSSGRYVMLADDDDVWEPDKIAITLAEMKRIEAGVGSDVPILVHTDLKVVDTGLATVSDSMIRAQRLAARETRLARLLVQNSVTGCTVMVNGALARLVREPFDDIAMHDWWLTLIAASLGRIAFVDTPTVLYRQHGRNAVGAVDARNPGYLLSRALGGAATRARMAAATRQAATFLDQFGDRLSPDQRHVVSTLANLNTSRKLRRIWSLGRYGLWKNTLPRRLGQVWFV